MQMEILGSCISDDTLKIARNLNSEAQKTPDVVIAVLGMHARGQVNVVMEWRNLNLCSQLAGGTVWWFSYGLTRSCQNFWFCFCNTCEGSLIPDHFVVDIHDNDIAERLLA